jgi:hypothetical protein
MRSSIHRPRKSQPRVASSMVMARLEWMLYGEDLVQSLKLRPLILPRRATKAIDQDRTASRH